MNWIWLRGALVVMFMPNMYSNVFWAQYPNRRNMQLPPTTLTQSFDGSLSTAGRIDKISGVWKMPYENHSTEIMGNLLIPTQSKCPVLSNVRDCHVSLYYILIEKIPNCSHSCLINFNFNRTDFETQCVTSSARRQEPSRIRYLDPDALPSVLHNMCLQFARMQVFD